MAERSELIWVTVPGGIKRQVDPSVALLRVVIIPKLSGTTLASGGMEHWPPQALTSDPLTVHFSRSPEITGRVVTVPPPHIQAQPGLWETFFRPEIIVTPAQGRTPAISEVDVADTSQDARDIKATFDAVARTEVTGDSSAALDPVIRRELAAKWSNNPRSTRRSNNGFQASAVPVFDFHRSVAMLREHPAVLRALGLIIDIKLSPSELFADPSERFVQVLWPGSSQVPGLADVISPWTEFGREFFPASTTNIHAGMVTLTDELNPPNSPEEARWDVVTVDVNNGVSRLRAAASALNISPPGDASEANDGSPESGLAALPALRTAGLLLVRKGRREDFAARRNASTRNAARSSMNEAVFTADDLVLGYRLDISRSFGKWFSLHRRSAQYRVNDTIPIGGEPTEEGHIKAHAAVDDQDGSGMLRADEVVARWSGWSLAVRQPTFDAPNGQAVAPANAQRPYNLNWKFDVVPGSLPRLRFTSTYRIRARVVDLAGGGLDFDDPAADRCATEEIAYRRFEPIASPDIQLPDGVDSKQLGPSESVGLVVIRSDSGDVATFFSQNPSYTPNTRRILFPPRASITLAEQHGMFDKPDGADGDEWEKQTWEWVSRAMATGDSGNNTQFPDPAAGGVCVFIRSEPGGFPSAKLPRPWEQTWPDLKSKEVELLERPESSSIANPLVWNGDRLKVSLAKAEQITLEISSLMKDNFLDHFAIKDPLPAVSENTVLTGRHPMVTPTRTITLVHAVRRPLKEPSGALASRREPGQTFTVLDPDPVRLNIDLNSTGQVELMASWTEPSDDTTQTVEGAHVQTITVNRGDERLKDPLKHEFGDTRHRMVTYSMTAVSRFRSFFHEQGEDPQAFLVSRQLGQPVNVRSTARPPVPVVISTRPAFQWEEQVEGSGTTMTVRRRRLGGGLRVELGRPWFQTGEAEQLAVLVAKDLAPEESLRPFLSQVGRDPIWNTSLLNRWPTAIMFRGLASDPTEQVLAEAGQSVGVVPYAVWFHNGRWYADIAMPEIATASYCPMVQLAVARYQANSLPSLELSSMVKTEMVPLFPERVLTVRRSGDSITLTLDGLGPTGPQRNRIEALLEECRLPAGVSPSLVEFSALETVTDGTPAWVPVQGQISRSDLGSGGLQLSIPGGSGPVRVRVREIELVGSEAGVPAPHTTTPDELSERVVFADVLPLSSS